MTAQRKLLRHNHGVISTYTNKHTHTHACTLHTCSFFNFLKRSTQLSHQQNPTEKATGKGFLPEPRFKPSNPWSWVNCLCSICCVYLVVRYILRQLAPNHESCEWCPAASSVGMVIAPWYEKQQNQWCVFKVLHSLNNIRKVFKARLKTKRTVFVTTE